MYQQPYPMGGTDGEPEKKGAELTKNDLEQLELVLDSHTLKLRYIPISLRLISKILIDMDRRIQHLEER